MALISVIVPIYKVEPYIRRCIDSVLSQTFMDFELILVDDGSPDNCPAICDEYASKDKRIHVIHQKNGGLSAARNAGIEWLINNKHSKWVTFIDSDDWVHEKYLELLYSAVQEYEVNISQCIMHKTNGVEPLPLVGNNYIVVTPEEQYIKYYHPNFCGKLLNIRCFEKMRFPVGKLYEDVAIWYRFLFSEEKIAVVKEPLYYYFCREDSIVNSSWTPKQLDQVAAWDEQIKYLKSYQNENVYKAAIHRYLIVLTGHLSKLENSLDVADEDREKCSKILKEKLGKTLKENRSFLRSEKYYDWYYELAHPRLSWLIWTVKGIANKFWGTGNE